MLHDLLGISAKEKRVVSLLGGGGKTTLMYALSRESAQSGNTALFTTTNIFVPDETDVVLLEPFTEEKAISVWSRKKIVSAGRHIADSGKLAAPEEWVQKWLYDHGEGLYIEADGSKRMPLKYPASWEPVMPEGTTHTVVVAGLSALGQPRKAVVHRAELAEKACGYVETVISEEGMADLLMAGYGRFDPVYLLNQADTPEMEARGQRVAERLISHGARRVVVVSLKKCISDTGDSLPND